MVTEFQKRSLVVFDCRGACRSDGQSILVVTEFQKCSLVVFDCHQLFPSFPVGEVVQGKETDSDAGGKVLVQFVQGLECDGVLLLGFWEGNHLDDVVPPTQVIVCCGLLERIVWAKDEFKEAFGGGGDVRDGNHASLLG